MSSVKVKSKGIIQSIDKAVDILCCFSISEPEIGISELASRLALYKSTVHRTLRTLEERGFIVQNPQNQKYRLGFKLFELGNAVIAKLEVREVALPLMRQLGFSTSETVTLNVRDDDDRVCIEKVEGTESVRIVVQIGLRAPIYVAAPGKVLLAYLPADDIERILKGNLGYTATGERREKQALRDELSLIKERGYSLSASERSVGTLAVAAPIRNHEGKVIACIGLSGPESRFNDRRMDEGLITETVNMALEISRRLGWREGVYL